MFTASGSCGAIAGAKIALATIASRMTLAATPHRRRPRRRSDPWSAVGSSAVVTVVASSVAIRAIVLRSSAGFAGATLSGGRFRKGGEAPLRESGAHPDARIDDPDDEVPDDVGRHDDGREQDDRALDHREILVADRLHGEGRHARPGEDRLRDDGAAEELAELEPQDRDDRDARVAEGVLDDDRALAHPFGAGGLDVLHVHDLDHAGPDQTHGDRGEGGAQAEGRHDEVLPGAVARGRERPEPHGEDDDEHDAEPEDRQRLSADGERGTEVVDERVALEGGQDAERQRDEQGHDEAGQRQIDRRGHALEDQAERRRVGVPRCAEVPLDGVARELPVLEPDRLVEPQELPVALELRVAGVLGQEEEHGVAEDVQDDEGEDRDADDDDDQLDELTGDVATHVREGGRGGGGSERVAFRAEEPAPPRPDARYCVRGVTRNMRSISSRGAWYSTRFEMPQTPRRPHLKREAASSKMSRWILA